MPSKRFKVYLDKNPASAEWLARILSITVDQEVDHAWAAELTLQLCLSSDGTWTDLDTDIAYERIRIELQVGTDPWVPLIDGPLSGHHTQLSAEPGRSQLILNVLDDSSLLNLTDVVTISDGQSDSDIATQLFSSDQVNITPENIATLEAPAEPLEATEVQRGTNANFLRRLAERNALHAYVLPGADVNAESRGFFCAFPESSETPSLDSLVLLGASRNVMNFDVQNDTQAAAEYQISTLGLSDRSTTPSTGAFQDETLLGGGDPDSTTPPATRLPNPALSTGVDPAALARAQSIASSYTYEATGQIYSGRYSDILTPYQLIAVQAGGTSLSGNYMIKRVRHVINRSDHTQEFTVQRQVRATIGSAVTDLLAAIF